MNGFAYRVEVPSWGYETNVEGLYRTHAGALFAAMRTANRYGLALVWHFGGAFYTDRVKGEVR